MEAVKQKKTFKESMKETGGKAKEYARKQTDTQCVLQRVSVCFMRQR